MCVIMHPLIVRLRFKSLYWIWTEQWLDRGDRIHHLPFIPGVSCAELHFVLPFYSFVSSSGLLHGCLLLSDLLLLSETD